PLLALFEIFRQTENAIGEHIGKHVEHHFVAGPLVRLIALAAAWIWFIERIIKPADDVGGKKLAILLGCLFVFLDRLRVRQLLHELLPYVWALGEEVLGVADDFVDLALLARSRLSRICKPFGKLQDRSKSMLLKSNS